MKIVELRSDGTGVVDLDGSRHEANLSLIDSPALGDYVIVHAGFAIEKLNEKEANEQLALFAEMARVGGQPPSPGGSGVPGRSEVRSQRSAD